ncbi:FliO/MopB family protein [bacterium]|nr:FliO/MopB family protein [bacterium]
MKSVILVLFMIISTTLFAGNILDSSIKEGEYYIDAEVIFDSPVKQGDAYLSYQGDLVTLSIPNSTLIQKPVNHDVTKKKVVRTLIHQPNKGRVDFRLRYKSASIVKPELNDILYQDNKIIFRSYYSLEDKELIAKRETLASQKESELKEKKEDKPQIVKTTPLLKIEEKQNEEKIESQQKMKSGSFLEGNSTILFLFFALIGAGYFYIKKKKPNLLGGNTDIHILSNRAIGAKKQLILIEVNGQNMLLASSESGIQVLSEMDMKNSVKSELKNELKQKNVNFTDELDDEINTLENRFFDQQNIKKNPYENIKNSYPQDDVPEVVSHIKNRKLKNIQKL